jgi:hypothetical protein
MERRALWPFPNTPLLQHSPGSEFDREQLETHRLLRERIADNVLLRWTVSGWCERIDQLQRIVRFEQLYGDARIGRARAFDLVRLQSGLDDGRLRQQSRSPRNLGLKGTIGHARILRVDYRCDKESRQRYEKFFHRNPFFIEPPLSSGALAILSTTTLDRRISIFAGRIVHRAEGTADNRPGVLTPGQGKTNSVRRTDGLQSAVDRGGGVSAAPSGLV